MPKLSRRGAAVGVLLAGLAPLLGACGRTPNARAAAAPQAAPIPAAPCPASGLLAEARGPIPLNGARMVRLAGACPGPAITAHLRALGPETRFLLVADDLRAGVQPGALFALRLAPPSTGEAAVLGTISFFAARTPSGAGQPRSISFDVTRQVRALSLAGWPDQGLGVSFAPSGPLAPGADATMGALRLVAQAPR